MVTAYQLTGRMQEYSESLMVTGNTEYDRIEDNPFYGVIADKYLSEHSGYTVKNISDRDITCAGFTINAGEEVYFSLSDFFNLALAPELSFRFANGRVCSRIPFKEIVEVWNEHGKKGMCQNYEFIYSKPVHRITI